MTSKIRVEIDDATQAGADGVADNLKDIGKEADKAGKQLNEAAKAADDVGDATIDGLRKEFDDAADAVDRLKSKLNAAGNEADDAAGEFVNVREVNLGDLLTQLQSMTDHLEEIASDANRAQKELKEVGDATKKAGGGGSMFEKLGKAVTGVNQALEIGKKVAEVAGRALAAMAEKGVPGAVKLQGSLDSVKESLFAIGDSEGATQLFEGLADVINTQLLPVLRESRGMLSGVGKAVSEGAGVVSTAFTDAQNAISNANLAAAEYFGLIDEGISDQLKLTRESREAIDDQNRALAEQEAQTRRLSETEKLLSGLRDKASEQRELQAIAANDSEQTLITLLEEEKDAILEAAKAGTTTKESQERSLRKIETIERRLIELPKERAEAEIKSQEEINKARHDAAEKAKADYDEVLRKVQENTDAEKKAVADAEAEKRKERERALQSAIAPQIEKARQSLTPEQTREAVIKQRQAEARQKLIDSRRADVDAEGKAIARDPQERAQKQRQFDRELATQDKTIRQETFKAFNQQSQGQKAQNKALQFGVESQSIGKIEDSEVLSAQNELLRGQTDAAQKQGTLGSETAKTFREMLATQQQAANEQARMAQELVSIQQALGGVQSAQTNNSSRARAQMGQRRGAVDVPLLCALMFAAGAFAVLVLNACPAAWADLDITPDKSRAAVGAFVPAGLFLTVGEQADAESAEDNWPDHSGKSPDGEQDGQQSQCLRDAADAHGTGLFHSGSHRQVSGAERTSAGAEQSGILASATVPVNRQRSGGRFG